MKNMNANKLDEVSRRQFVKSAAKSCLGVSILPFAGSLAATAPSSTAGGSAKHVIYLFMNGAMSHLDTFDPKPDSNVQGDTKAIKTNVSGVQLGEHFTGLAKKMDKLALVRSLNSTTGAHRPGRYLMRTSYKEIATTRHPSLGAWTQNILGKLNPDLPGSVVVGGDNLHPAAGFMEAQYSPVPIGSASAGLQNTKPPKYLEDSMFRKRMTLASQFDSAFQKKYQHAEVAAYTQLYREAVKLLDSKDLQAFDISKESEKTRAAYGDNQLGQGCLLARRLVESKVRFIEVVFGGWDHHREIYDNLPEKAQALDQALTALLNDLEGKGLLASTLVVVCSEFGRTPKINQNTGRDHHPGAFTGVLAGGGIKGGEVYGASDDDGFSVDDDPVTPADFNATIAYGLGLPLKDEIFSKSGRPFTVAHDGGPLKKLFS
jgi:uncharacterized protein (DUF1501 family)